VAAGVGRRRGMTARRTVAALVAAAALAGAEPAAADVTIAWGGDLTLGSSYGHPPARGWPQLAPVAGVLRSADLAAVNYEGTFAPGGASKCSGGGNCFAFQAPAANAASLSRAGVDVVNLANNHAFDFGAAGYRGTRAALDRADVRATGAPGQVQVLRTHGVKVAFVGFSSYAWSASINDDRQVDSLVRAAAREADLVVAFFHGGAEGAGELHVPHGREHAFGEDRGDLRRFARRAIDAGADAVLGSGPHVLRGMELYKRRLIAYSLGNLSGWRNFGTGGMASYSAVLTVRLAPGGRLTGGRVTSLRLDRIGVPRVDPTRGAERLMRRLSRSDFGSAGVWFTLIGALRPGPLAGVSR
jgi:poly-gamma-glutamate capsule biosynthesis protein CapA/YwtB (metallophosphatase superfamily)